MIKMTKVLSIIIFKRFFNLYPFLIFLPKFVLLKHNLNNYIHLKKYILKFFNSQLNLFNYNTGNLIFFYFSSKKQFLDLFFKTYLSAFSIKYNNIFFYFNIFLKKNLFLFSSKYFFFKLKLLFYNVLKYIYSFNRFFKNL